MKYIDYEKKLKIEGKMSDGVQPVLNVLIKDCKGANPNKLLKKLAKWRNL